LGNFDQEVSLLVDGSLRHRTYTVGGVVSPCGLGALYPVLDTEQLLIGEELFAGGAAVTDNPIYKASQGVQNILRTLVIFSIMVTMVLSILGVMGN